MTGDRVIGSGIELPWHLPEDLQLFSRITRGNTVIMGRTTFEAIGHPLPERLNIVLSRSGTDFPGVVVCRGFLDGLAVAARHGRPIFIIGGSSVYSKAMPIATELHISWVDGAFHGDRFFPPFDLSAWVIVEERACHGFHYVHYRRIPEPSAAI